MFHPVFRLAVVLLAAGGLVHLANGSAPAHAASWSCDMQVLDIGLLSPVSAPPEIYRYRLNSQCIRTEKPLPVLSGMTDTGVLLADADGLYHLGLVGQPAVRALLEACG